MQFPERLLLLRNAIEGRIKVSESRLPQKHLFMPSLGHRSTDRTRECETTLDSHTWRWEYLWKLIKCGLMWKKLQGWGIEFFGGVEAGPGAYCTQPETSSELQGLQRLNNHKFNNTSFGRLQLSLPHWGKERVIPAFIFLYVHFYSHSQSVDLRFKNKLQDLDQMWGRSQALPMSQERNTPYSVPTMIVIFLSFCEAEV
jgi:hypothetical protein